MYSNYRAAGAEAFGLIPHLDAHAILKFLFKLLELMGYPIPFSMKADCMCFHMLKYGEAHGD